MLTAEAQIETERPSRYLVQFCKHAAAMGAGGGHGPRVHLGDKLARREVRVDAEWSDTHGTVTFTPWGACTLEADADTLTVRIEATDEDNLRQIQDIVTRDFDRFSRRDPLTVTWHHSETPNLAAGEEAGSATPTHTGKPATRRRRLSWKAIVLAAVAVLAVALHLGLGGAVLTNSRWTTGAVVIVAAIIALKIVLIVLGRRGIHHHKAAKAHHNANADHDAKAER